MKTIFVDLGGTLIHNYDNHAVLNIELFELLKKHKDSLHLVILSDTKYDTDQILGDFKITETFHPIVITKKIFNIDKTKPETYLFACDKVHVKPQDCLLIDNEPTFIAAANRAHLKTVSPADPMLTTILERFLY